MLADAGAAAFLAQVAPLSMLAEAGAVAILALDAPRAVLADAGATACLAFLLPLTKGHLLFFQIRRLTGCGAGGVWRCRSCWGCQIHGGVL